MHVAILGAGALGRVYGARLAMRAPVEVSFVVRPAMLHENAPFLLERVDDRDDVLRLESPARVSDIPAHADVVLVCVRAEQLDDDLVKLLACRPTIPTVMLTPMMPGDYERMRTLLGPRVIAAMPGVVAYVRDDGVVRYWVPRTAPTLIEEQRPVNEAVTELERMLTRAGLHTKTELGVHESNPATTVTFIPIAMALDVGGGVDALLDDEALLDVALRAASEGLELAHRIGKVATWASLLTKFVSRATLKIGIGIAKQKAPEAIFYAEMHFGRKLHAQNVAMAEAIVRLAEEKGTPHAALAELRDRLKR